MVLDAAEERGLDAGRLDARPLAVAPEAREELDEAVPPVRAAQQQRAARAEQRAAVWPSASYSCAIGRSTGGAARSRVE